MTKFETGVSVKVINPGSKYFGQTGQVDSNYRSGLEAQAYGVRFDDGNQFWVLETDLDFADNRSKNSEKGSS